MTREDRLCAAVLAAGLTVAGVLELASVPGPWWSVAGLVGSGTLFATSRRTNVRREREHQEAFAERLRRIRAREIPPRDLPG